MIERRAEFIRELDSLCENIVNCGELNYDEEKMEERFLYQSSASPENIECIKNLEYGIVMQSVPYDENKLRKFYSLKIKGTNIRLTDIAFFLERDEVVNIVLKEYPELSVTNIEAALRAITLMPAVWIFRVDEAVKEVLGKFH